MSVLKDDIKTISELWGASIYAQKTAEEIEFTYCAIGIIKNYGTVIETKNFYFTSRDLSTKYFYDSTLDKEYRINDSLTVFYSGSKDKCIEWLERKREEMILYHESCYKRLLESEIKEREQ